MNIVEVDNSQVEVVVNDSSVSLNVCENITEVVVGDTGPQGPRGGTILAGHGEPSIVIGLIGDMYIDKDTNMLYGPKTSGGWGDPVFLGSGLTIADVAHSHLQTIPSQTWVITHTLQFTPNIVVVSLVNGTQQEVIGDYEYNGNTITATFSQPIAGAAYLS